MDFLKDKCLKSTKTVQLANCIVDGKIYGSFESYIPCINLDDIVYVEFSTEAIIKLHNITSNEWEECEIPLTWVDDFKIIKKDEI